MYADDAEDANDAINLGLTSDIAWDWEKGEFYDGFDGYWFSLPNGQNLAIYNMTVGDGYDVYSSPVDVNGDYEYGFLISDIFGGSKTTDLIDIIVDDDGYYYVEQ